jgi:cytochrome c biogenesis protein CcmG/thiol:disulfide interchange protein DsbE
MLDKGTWRRTTETGQTCVIAIDWGVYRVLENFMVDGQGRIAYKQIGAITPEIFEQTILPLIERLRGKWSIPHGSVP